MRFLLLLCLSEIAAAFQQLVPSHKSSLIDPKGVSSIQGENAVSSTELLLSHKLFKNRKTPFSSSSTLASLNDDSEANQRIDWGAMAKYAVAVSVQTCLFAGIFKGLDILHCKNAAVIPRYLIIGFFYVITMKSRAFNPLCQRPRRKNAPHQRRFSGRGDRKMPQWVPPDGFFPILWLCIMCPLRAFSTYLIFVSEGGTLCNCTILSLLLHLAVCDVSNTISKEEKRYGTAATAATFAVGSAALASWKYYAASPLAGKLLSATGVWLTFAWTIAVGTWWINPDGSGIRRPLLPVQGEAETAFTWLQ